MPAANSTGSTRIAYQGSANAAAPPASTSRRDLGGGVEAQPEQQADRVHVPRLADRPGHAAEEPVHEAAVVQLLLELGLVVLARAHPPEDPDDADGGDQVDQADEQQEHARDGRADQRRCTDAAESTRPATTVRRAPAPRRRAAGWPTKTTEEWPRENQKPDADRPAGPRPSACGWCCRSRRCGRRRRRAACRACRPSARRPTPKTPVPPELVVRAARPERPARPSRRRAAAGRSRPCRGSTAGRPAGRGSAAGVRSVRAAVTVARAYCEQFATSVPGRRPGSPPCG